MSSTVPELPPGWRVVRRRGPLGFVTHAVLARPDGSEVEWTSRRHRKGLGLRGTGPRGGRASALSWWIGGLFALGSVCFALGSLPVYFDRVAPEVVGWTFFVGSIFFTSAASLQLAETLRAPAAGSLLRRIDFWAVLVQLVGTVFFNLSTFAATRSDLTLTQERHLVWAPDVGGSICFLVASWLAYAEVNRGILPRSDRSVGWSIAALNLLGSVAFGVAAVAARYLRSTGELANLPLVNLGTFLGAVCFLVGAGLLPVESAKERSPS